MSEIVIYKAKDGHIELTVNLAEEKELEEDSVVRNFRITAADGKTYDTKHYNLDVIISVGYRVRSQQGTAFRQWATRVLNQHLIQGYTTYEKRLAERGVKELQQTVAHLQKTLVKNELVSDLGVETIQLIISYAKTWNLLLAYDEDRLALPEKGKRAISSLHYNAVVEAIASLKADLAARNEATALFGDERDGGFESILNNLEQTFGGEPLYKTTEEKAPNKSLQDPFHRIIGRWANRFISNTEKPYEFTEQADDKRAPERFVKC